MFESERKSVALACDTAAGRAMTTTSTAGRAARWRRKDARTSRLMRFLSMALRAAFLEIASPRRAQPTLLGRARTVKNRSACRSGQANTWEKSRAQSSRAPRGKARAECAGGRGSVGAIRTFPDGGSPCVHVISSTADGRGGVRRPWPRSAGSPGGSGREALAALGAATVDDLPAVFGGHARPESVGTGTALFSGLVGTFHDARRPW